MEEKTATTRVYACVNQKGGVGKSVSSTNLGIGLARHGHKVLIVDLDSQASQTVSAGWKRPDELPVTIATQLAKVVENRPFDPREGILHHHEGADLMPSSIELSGIEMRMVNAMSREFILRTYLEAVKPDYDAIILDCPPTLGMMTINALAAADRVIVPVQPEYLSVIGMTQLFDTVALVKKQINPSLKIEGVLITLANMRTNLAKNTLAIIQEAYISLRSANDLLSSAWEGSASRVFTQVISGLASEGDILSSDLSVFSGQITEADLTLEETDRLTASLMTGIG